LTLQKQLKGSTAPFLLLNLDRSSLPCSFGLVQKTIFFAIKDNRKYFPLSFDIHNKCCGVGGKMSDFPKFPTS